MSEVLDTIVNQVVNELKERIFIEVEASGRHIHLSRADADSLFGKAYQFTKLKDLSQPGQYACKERVTLTGPKGKFDNVIVLGPERSVTQVEVSITDALVLGIKSPIRQSGDIEGTPGLMVSNGDAKIQLEKGLIVAKRHVHITVEDAQRFAVVDGEVVKVKVLSERPIIFGDTVVRVSKDFRTCIHIDYDEANACGFKPGTLGIILK